MRSPSQSTVRRLFAVSGNCCCYPDCTSSLVADDGAVLGEICHIRARNEGGARFDTSLTEAERHSFENLMLLCRNHHRIVDARNAEHTVEMLLDIKARHERRHARTETSRDNISARNLLRAASPIEVHGNNGTVVIGGEGAVIAKVVHVRSSGSKTTVLSPVGTIGAAAVKLRYVEYLIKRYNEYACREPSRSSKFSHAAIRTNIASRYGARVQLLPLERFLDLCEYLQQRISRTRIAKANHAKGHRSFSTFDEYDARVSEAALR